MRTRWQPVVNASWVEAVVAAPLSERNCYWRLLGTELRSLLFFRQRLAADRAEWLVVMSQENCRENEKFGMPVPRDAVDKSPRAAPLAFKANGDAGICFDGLAAQQIRGVAPLSSCGDGFFA